MSSPNKTTAEKKAEYYLANREKFLQKAKERRSLKAEEINANGRAWYKANKGDALRQKRRDYDKKRYQDPIIRLTKSMRVRLYRAFKTGKSKSTDKLVGCSFEHLKKHLEDLFQSGMSWENYGKWHVDHIMPLATAKNSEELEKLCYYTNLQPLWAEDNRKKAKKRVY